MDELRGLKCKNNKKIVFVVGPVSILFPAAGQNRDHRYANWGRLQSGGETFPQTGSGWWKFRVALRTP